VSYRKQLAQSFKANKMSSDMRSVADQKTCWVTSWPLCRLHYSSVHFSMTTQWRRETKNYTIMPNICQIMRQ